MATFARTTASAAAIAIAFSLPASAGGIDPPPLFSEISAELGVNVVHLTSGFSHSNYTPGGAVGDFNNDGCQDFFAISGGSNNQPDRLFINNCDGTFTNQSAAWGLTAIHRGKGASVGDFNKDGWPDLYVTSAGLVGGVGPGQHRLYRNNGNGTFTNVAAAAGVNMTAAVEDGFGSCWGDYDLDGDLDLFVAGFAVSNSGSRLFRNNGDETFTDVTAAIGLFSGTPVNMAGFTPRLVDMDGDRYPELLFAADFGTSRYFRNDTDGTFTDITEVSNTSQEENGMGANVGDYNSDGRLDWYVTSIFFPSIGWTGDKLYINLGNHLYHEAASVLGCADGGYGWGTVLVDFNHDGRLDIAETNGDTQPGSQFWMEPSYLWMQEPNGTFTEMAAASGFNNLGPGRGMVNFDYDNDGDQDVVIFKFNTSLRFFRNDLSGPGTNWLRVFLDTSNVPALAPNGTGARVIATVDGDSQYRWMTSGDNFESHSELSAHFGLGAATIVDELLVEWPDGSTTSLTDVAVNQTITIEAGAGVPGDVDGDGAVGVTDLLALLAMWGACPKPCPPSCDADFNDDCTVGIADLLVLLGNWG